MNKPKGYTKADQWKNLDIARYGRLDGDLVRFVNEAEELYKDVPALARGQQPKTNPWLTIELAQQWQRDISETMLQELATAIEKQDGRWFRALADAIDQRIYVSDKNRLWLHGLLFKLTRHGWVQKNFFSRNALQRMAQKQGWHISDRRMFDICKALGARFTQGRPAKSRNKLKH